MSLDLANAGLTLQRLESVERDMQDRQGEMEEATADRFLLERDWEKRQAICLVRADGPNADSRKASALIKAIELDDLFERFQVAVSRHEALRAVYRVMSDRASVLQTIVRVESQR